MKFKEGDYVSIIPQNYRRIVYDTIGRYEHCIIKIDLDNGNYVYGIQSENEYPFWFAEDELEFVFIQLEIFV